MKNTSTTKRPKDINQLAKLIVEQATEDKTVKQDKFNKVAKKK